MTNEDLKDSFYYDGTSPTFLRHAKDKWTGRGCTKLQSPKDSIAGGVGKAGNYLVVGFKGKMLYIHRVVMMLFGHDIEGKQVDHKDLNVLNNSISNLRVVDNALNNRNRLKMKNNTSNKTGVNLVSSRGLDYFRAYCTTMSGKSKSKWFSISKLGVMVAFRDAVIYRQKMLVELNLQGAGYSERHGL